MADLILIACHGPLAAALKDAAELIVGRTYPIIAAGPYEGDFAVIDEAITAALDQVGPDGRVFAVTDLFGGSVNTRLAGVQDPRVTLIAGANLGLVIELATSLRRLDADRLGRVIDRARSGLRLVELTNDTEEEDF